MPEFTDGVSTLIKHKWKIVMGIIIFFIAVTFVYVIFPLLDGIILGIVLAYVARPIKHFLDRYTPRLSPYLATTAIVLPIFLIIGLGIADIVNRALWAIENQNYVVSVLLNVIERLQLPDFIRERARDVILNFTSYLLPIIKQLPVGAVTNALWQLSIFAINILISIVLCFYLLVDGGVLVERIMDIIPAEIEEFFRGFLKHLDSILSAMFIGNTYSAIAIGIISLVVFWAFGFTDVLALSALMLIAAIVPLFAGWMVILPLGVYRYFQEGGESALFFLTISFLVIIIPPELLIRPYIINTRSNIHPMLIIIAFLGGGLVGGIAGFFIAPILLGAIVAAYRANAELQKRALKR